MFWEECNSSGVSDEANLYEKSFKISLQRLEKALLLHDELSTAWQYLLTRALPLSWVSLRHKTNLSDSKIPALDSSVSCQHFHEFFIIESSVTILVSLSDHLLNLSVRQFITFNRKYFIHHQNYFIPIWVMRCLKFLELMVPVPYLSSTLKAILIMSASLTVFILSDIMLQNSGNSIIPDPSVSYWISKNICQI